MKNETPSKIFQTNVSVNLSPRINGEYDFRILYNQAMREESKKNPIKKLGKSLNQMNSINTSHIQIKPKLAHFDTEHFHLDKKIKEIRKQTKEKGYDLQKRDNQIAFSKDHIDIVFESNRLLKEIEKRKMNSLSDNDGALSVFLNDNKEIAIKNLLIKLLNKEGEKIKETDTSISKVIVDDKNTLLSQQKLFNDLIEKQKKICKEIEFVLIDVQKNNFELAETEKRHKNIYKAMEDEIEKQINMINNDRVCAKFILKVMGEDTSKFDKEINFIEAINTGESTINKKINYAATARNVVNDYEFCLKNNNNDSFTIPEDPYVFIEKFHNYEDMIVKGLQFKRGIDEDYNKQSNDQNKILHELQAREAELLHEETSLYNEYNQIANRISFWQDNNNRNQNHDLFMLIKELSIAIIGKDTSYKTKGRYKTIAELTEDSIDGLKVIETKMNDLLRLLIQCEYDTGSFYQIVNQRKTQNKESKQLEAKYNMEMMQNMKRKKAEERFNRIIVQSRKTEPAYHHKRKVRKVLACSTDNDNGDEDEMLRYD